MKKTLLVAMLIASMTLVGCGCGSTSNEPVQGTEVVEVAEQPEVVETETVEDSEMSETGTEEVLEETEREEVIELTETELPEAPAYTVTEMSAVKYAKSAVNVRKGPSTDYEKVGSLSTNQEVTVTGQCNETKWYRIEFDGAEAYVSNNYLVDEKVVVSTGNSGTVTDEGATGGGSVVPVQGSTSTPIQEQPATSTPSNDNSTNNSSEVGTFDSVEDLEVGEEIGDTGLVWGGTFDEEFVPTTDGYGEGITITINPVP